MNFKKILSKYAEFVSYRPYLMLFIIFILLGVAGYLAQGVQTTAIDNSDIIPDDYKVVKAYKILNNTFNSPDNILISLEIDPKYKNSNEIKDIRDYRVLEYIEKVSSYVSVSEYVSEVDSISSLIKTQNETLLKNNTEINKFIKENQEISSQYISDDYKMGLIKISLSSNYSDNDDKELVNSLSSIVSNIDKPPGLKVNVAGAIASYPIMDEQLGPDMQKTSSYSILGIVIILLLIFVVSEIVTVFRKKSSFKSKIFNILFSLRFGITPLTTIIVGVVWAFGFIALLGMGLNSATSGVISMIMGIGIDFGIQTVIRYREELKFNNPNKAMKITLQNVFMPMATTTIAALIGFKAMTMGELSIISELGTIMSYGIAACFLAAITIVPTLLVLFEKTYIYLNNKYFLEKGGK